MKTYYEFILESREAKDLLEGKTLFHVFHNESGEIASSHNSLGDANYHRRVKNSETKSTDWSAGSDKIHKLMFAARSKMRLKLNPLKFSEE